MERERAKRKNEPEWTRKRIFEKIKNQLNLLVDCFHGLTLFKGWQFSWVDSFHGLTLFKGWQFSRVDSYHRWLFSGVDLFRGWLFSSYQNNRVNKDKVNCSTISNKWVLGLVEQARIRPFIAIISVLYLGLNVSEMVVISLILEWWILSKKTR
jgi:hypothetical protein